MSKIMAINMEIVTRNFNIVGLFDSIDIRNVSNTELIQIFLDQFDKDPVITQFPDFLLAVSQDKGFSVNMDSRRLIVTNQTSVRINNISFVGDLVRVFTKVKKLLKGSSLRSYGFNFQVNVELESERKELLQEFIEKEKSELLKKLSTRSISAVGYRFFYRREKGLYNDLKIEPVYGPDAGRIVSVNFLLNTHYNEEKIPKIKDLEKSYNDEIQYFQKIIEQMLNLNLK